MNKKHKNMKFSIETEINRSLSFLDVKIFRENNKFVTSVFTKETFNGVYTNILLKNAYPQKFIDQCIQKFLNIMFIQRLQIPSVPKKELRITLPYLELF